MYCKKYFTLIHYVRKEMLEWLLIPGNYAVSGENEDLPLPDTSGFIYILYHF
jgi:hypothetical protein